MAIRTGSVCSSNVFMQELICVKFESGIVPEEWFVEARKQSFEQNCYRTHESAWFIIPLPKCVWKQIHVEIKVRPLSADNIECSIDDVLSATVVLSDKLFLRHTATKFQHCLAARTESVVKKEGFRTVAFEFDGRLIKGFVDGQEIINGNDPIVSVLAGTVRIGFSGDYLVEQICVFGEKDSEHSPALTSGKRNNKFSLGVTVDFFDDVINAPFTKEMLQGLFKEFSSWGVTRVDWMYNGKLSEGYWDFTPHGVAENYRMTHDNVGEVFNAAVEAAHAYDIKIYGLLKPFDQGIKLRSYGDGTQDAKQKGKLPRIGGPIGWVANPIVRNRAFETARKPNRCGPSVNKVFTRIDLIKEDDKCCAFSVDDVRIYVSDDNYKYRLYEGPIVREEVIGSSPESVKPNRQNSRIYRFSRLNISSKYIAISTDSRAGSFVNTLENLVQVFGENGREHNITYGLGLRHDSSKFSGSDEVGGIEFDTYPGTPSALYGGGFDAIWEPFIFDSGSGIIGIARGKDSGALTILSPWFPEVRQLWLSWVQDILDAGADGVEIRNDSHCSDLAWSEYGFEKPVVDEFYKRYGVNILETDDFNGADLRRIRGEAYTQFYREARRLISDHGKLMGLHISNTAGGCDVEQGTPMEMHWDWRTWLEEELADSVTLKGVWPSSKLGQEVLSRMHLIGKEVVFCPYINNYPDGRGYGKKMIESLVNVAKTGDCDGYQLYECEAMIKATHEEKFIMPEPELRQFFQHVFKT